MSDVKNLKIHAFQLKSKRKMRKRAGLKEWLAEMAMNQRRKSDLFSPLIKSRTNAK
jgi:hypothetical protein